MLSCSLLSFSLLVIVRDGVLEHWPRTRGQNSMALASRLSGLGLGLEHSVLESIPGYSLLSDQLKLLICDTRR